MSNSVRIYFIIIYFALSGCDISYQVTKDKQINKRSFVYNSLDSKADNPDSITTQLDTFQSEIYYRRPLKEEVSSNISNFNPINQSFSLSVWNKGNGNLAFLNLGDYISQDSFEIKGYITNQNKNERLLVSKLYSTRDFNKISFEPIETRRSAYRINTGLDTSKNSIEGGLLLRNLTSYTTANGNIKTYRGIYSANDSEYEFIAQTDPIPLLIIIVGVAMASSATTYLLVTDSSEERLIVERNREYQECISNGGEAKIKLASNNLFSPDEFSFESCKRN